PRRRGPRARHKAYRTKSRGFGSMGRAWLLLAALLAPLAAPIALAHSVSPSPSPLDLPQTSAHELAPPTQGYTGPGREPLLSFFEGTWLYGQESATPLKEQAPVDLVGDGDWLVWEDANHSDIY